MPPGKVSDRIDGLVKAAFGRQIRFQVCFVDVTGSIGAALFLSQACYWQTACGVGEWWYKTAEQWYEEARLPRKTIEAARTCLRELKILEERRPKHHGPIYYRIDFDRLNFILGTEPGRDGNSDHDGQRTLPLSDTDQCPKGAVINVPNGQRSVSNKGTDQCPKGTPLRNRCLTQDDHQTTTLEPSSVVSDSVPDRKEPEPPGGSPADRLIRAFRRGFNLPISEPIQERELEQATRLAEELGERTAAFVVDHAVSSGSKTGFKPRVFGAVLAYRDAALNELRGREAGERRRQEEQAKRDADEAEAKAEQEAFAQLPVSERIKIRVTRRTVLQAGLKNRSLTAAEISKIRFDIEYEENEREQPNRETRAEA